MLVVATAAVVGTIAQLSQVLLLEGVESADGGGRLPPDVQVHAKLGAQGGLPEGPAHPQVQVVGVALLLGTAVRGGGVLAPVTCQSNEGKYKSQSQVYGRSGSGLFQGIEKERRQQ